MVCLNNLKQLQLAWGMYADDNSEKIVNGEAYGGGDGTAPVPTSGEHKGERWWTGDDVGDFMAGINLSEDVQKQAIRAGALYAYTGKEKLYRCPTGIRGEFRTYTITDAMNGLRRAGTYVGNTGRKVGKTILWVKNRMDIVQPGAAKRLVFLDEGRVTPDSYATHYETQTWWDPPFVRHANGTNVSFADGHVAYWRFDGKKTIETGQLAAIPDYNASSLHQMVPASEEDYQDLYRMQIAVWGRLGYSPRYPLRD